MRLEKLEIENFKCFKSKKAFDFSRITILTGANSSGKSTVMQAVLGAVQTDGFPFYYSPNGKYVNLGDFNEIISANNLENFFFAINIIESKDSYPIQTTWKQDSINFLPCLDKIKIETDKQTVEAYLIDENLVKFEFSFFEQFDIDLDFENIKKIFDTYHVAYNNDKVNNKFDIALALEDLEVFIFDIIDTKDYRISVFGKKVLRYLSLIRLSLIQEPYNNINYIGPYRNAPLRTYLEKNKLDFKVGTEGEGYIDQIVEWEKRSNGKIKKLVGVLKELDLIEDIKVNRLSGGRFELLVQAKNSKILTSLTNVGFGVSQFLPIIVADLQLSDNSTLFLAEPEIHLHPSIQSKFGEYIVNQVNTTEKNYVIETHSEYFLNRIRLAIVKGELKKEDVKVYFLENNGDDTEVFDIDFTKTGAIKNAPDNFFETYYMDTMDIALNAFAE